MELYKNYFCINNLIVVKKDMYICYHMTRVGKDKAFSRVPVD